MDSDDSPPPSPRANTPNPLTPPTRSSCPNSPSPSAPPTPSRQSDFLISEAREAEHRAQARAQEDPATRFDPHKATPWPMQRGKGYPKTLTAKVWFLTFPRSEVTKEQAMQRIKDKTGTNLRGCLVAQEQHQDGAKHLHVLIRLQKPFSTRNPRCFDYVCGKHGNYQTVRSPQAVRNYLVKEDPSPILYGEVQTGYKRISTSSSRSSTDGSIKPSQSKATSIAKGFLSGQLTLSGLLVTDPGYYFLNRKKIEDFASLSAIHLERSSKLPMVLPLRYDGNCHQTRIIVDWLNSNIRSNRPFKAKQLYIHGSADSRKTTLLNLLTKFLSIYDIPKEEDFYDFYDDEAYDLVVMDEFKGQKMIQWLNLFLQGGLMTLRRKGSQYRKKANLPVMILANFTLEQCYAKALERDPNKLDTLQTRLQVVEVVQPLDTVGFARALGLNEQNYPEMIQWTRADYPTSSDGTTSGTNSTLNGSSNLSTRTIRTGEPLGTTTIQLNSLTTNVLQRTHQILSISASDSSKQRMRRQKGKEPDDAIVFCYQCNLPNHQCEC